MKIIAIVNEKGGTGKTTTAVNLSAALGQLGRRVLLVDLDGQAASSRWFGVEEDNRLADALLAGGDLTPIPDVAEGVDLAPATGKLDSIAHDLRPTQGGQLRKVLAELAECYDYVLIDCPPSLGNRLIGNALLAATHAIVPVEPSILALDGLRILLTTLDDIRDGFGHDIELIGVLACRYETRTRLSRLVLAELNRGLPGKVFGTFIRETVRMQECPASGQSVLTYAPQSNAAVDYQALAVELDTGGPPPAQQFGFDGDLASQAELSQEERNTVLDFRAKVSAALFGGRKSGTSKKSVGSPSQPEGQPEPAEEPTPAESTPAADAESDWAAHAVPVCSTEPIDLYKDEPAQPDDAATETDEDSSAVPAEPAEQILQEMPTVFDPDELAGDQAVDAEEAVKDQPVPFEQVGPDRSESSSTCSAARSQNLKTAGTIGATALICLGLIGWFALRPEGTVSSVRGAIDATYEDITQIQSELELTSGDWVDIDDSSFASPGESAREPQPAQSQPGQVPAVLAGLIQRVISGSTEAEPLPSAIAASTDVSRTPSPAQQETIAQQATKDAPADDPSRSFAVTCVLLGSAGGRAVINRQLLAPGQSIGGAQLVRILPNGVEMQIQGRRFLLNLRRPGRQEHSVVSGKVRAQ